MSLQVRYSQVILFCPYFSLMGLANLVLGAPSQPEERQGAQKMILCCDVKPKKPSDFDTCRNVLPGSCDGYVAGRSGKRQTCVQTIYFT